MKLKIILFTLFNALLLSSYAQKITLSGYVTNNRSEALFAVTVGAQNSTIATTTDEKGHFRLTFPREGAYNIRVIMSGYELFETELTLTKDTVLNVLLEPSALNLNEVTVTSTRTPKLLKEVPVLTRVITADEIQKLNPSTLQDLLEMELSGLEFTRQMDGQTVLNMQGLGGSYLLFLMDGERIAGETLNNIDYNRLNVQNIERIEIVKGAASTLYGSSAIGGVINIITKNVQEPWQVSLSGRYGNNNEQRYGANIGWRAKDFSSLTSVTYRQIDSDTLYDAAEGDAAPRASYAFGGRDLSVDEKLTWQPISKLKMVAKGGYFFRDRYSAAKKQDRYRGFNAGFQAFYQISDKHQLQASYAFDQYNKYVNYLLLDSIPMTYNNSQHTGRLQYDFFINKRQTLTIGTEVFNDQLTTYQFLDDGKNANNTFVVFAQHDWNIFKGFTLLYGARLDYHSAFGAHFSPKVSVMYNIKNFVLRGSYGHGFRSPSLKELYTDWDHQGMFRLMGNRDLVPEKSNNFTLSAEYSYKRFNVSATGYYNHIKDKITTVWGSLDTVLHMNINKATIFGSDLNFAVKLPKGFGVRLSYSYVNDRQMDDGVNISDTRPHSITSRFTYDFNRKRYGLNVTLSGRFLAAMTTNILNNDDVYEEQRYPGYTMWKLTVNQRFCNSYILSLGVDNLFNYKPATYTYNTSMSPGTTFFVGLNIELDRAVKKKNYLK